MTIHTEVKLNHPQIWDVATEHLADPFMEALPEPVAVVQQDNGDGKVKIRLQLIKLSPDSTPYKVYSPEFYPTDDQPIQVQVEILRRYVKETKDDGTIVLSPMGLARIAKIITQALDKIYNAQE